MCSSDLAGWKKSVLAVKVATVVPGVIVVTAATVVIVASVLAASIAKAVMLHLHPLRRPLRQLLVITRHPAITSDCTGWVATA